MTGTAYQAGDRFEKRVKADLTRDGYWTIQTRGSKTVVDLVAVKIHQLLFIQAKSGDTGITHTGWNQLLELAQAVGALPIVADRGPAPHYPIRYRRITGPHIEHKQAWPAIPWTGDELALMFDPPRFIDVELPHQPGT